MFGKAIAFGRLERQCFRWRFERKRKRKSEQRGKKATRCHRESQTTESDWTSRDKTGLINSKLFTSPMYSLSARLKSMAIWHCMFRSEHAVVYRNIPKRVIVLMRACYVAI